MLQGTRQHKPAIGVFLESLRELGLPIQAEPSQRVRSGDGFAWAVAQGGKLPASPAARAWHVRRVLALRDDGATLLCRSPDGSSRILRLTSRTNAPPTENVPTPHRLDAIALEGHDNVLVRDYLRAHRLAELVTRPNHRAFPRIVGLARRIVAALRHVPEVFCLTPPNVYVDRFQRVVFTDTCLHGPLDLRHLYLSGSRSPGYFAWLAPEILRDGTGERTASLAYSIAAILWQALTGHPPPQQLEADPDMVHWRMARALDQLPGVPNTVRQFLITNCSPAPSCRSQSLEALDDALNALEHLQFRLRGTLAETLRRGYPWLRTRPRPKPRRILTPGARVAVWTGTIASVSVGVATLLPPEVGEHVLARLGISPPALPVASLRDHPLAHQSPRPRHWKVHTSEEFHDALSAARSGDVVTLVGPGPYVLDNTAVDASLTIAGADGALPLLAITGAVGLRATSERLVLTNLHFVATTTQPVEEVVAIAFSGGQLTMTDCSLQFWQRGGTGGTDSTGILVNSQHPLATVEIDNLYVRAFNNAVRASCRGGVRLALENTTFTGCSNAVDLAVAGQQDSICSVSLSRSTVIGGALAAVWYPPGYERGPLVELHARDLLALPYDKAHALLVVSYPSPSGQLLSHFSWTGHRVLCPTESRMMVIRYKGSRRAFIVDSVAQWEKLWRGIDTGVAGLPLPFAGSLPPGAALRATLGDAWNAVGADTSRHVLPDVATIATLLSRLSEANHHR